MAYTLHGHGDLTDMDGPGDALYSEISTRSHFKQEGKLPQPICALIGVHAKNLYTLNLD